MNVIDSLREKLETVHKILGEAAFLAEEEYGVDLREGL